MNQLGATPGFGMNPGFGPMPFGPQFPPPMMGGGCCCGGGAMGGMRDGCNLSPELSDPGSMLEELLMMLMMMMGQMLGGGGGMGSGFGGGGFGGGPMGGMNPFGGGGPIGGHHHQHGGGGHHNGNFGGGGPILAGGGARSLSGDPDAARAWNVGRGQGGTLQFTAGMAIDTDGKGSSHGDRWHQNQTSMRLANGSSLNADNTPYMVLPPQLAKQYGVKPGDLALVRRGDKVSPAIFGDVGPRHKLGEGSTRLAANLGINTDPNRGGTSSGVQYTVFPGSGRGVKWTDENTTTDALWQRIRAMQGG